MNHIFDWNLVRNVPSKSEHYSLKGFVTKLQTLRKISIIFRIQILAHAY